MTTFETVHRRRRLGDFLKVRRGSVRPEAVGLPAGRRRRTPGLKREELADLAGISAVWLARIEQGRDVSPSPDALARLAEALRLGRAERAHLFELAARADPAEPAHLEAGEPSPALAGAVEACAAAAYLIDGLWNVVAHNAAAAALFADWLGRDERPNLLRPNLLRPNLLRPNLLRYVFLNASARAFIHDWEERARRCVAEFRADFIRQTPSAANALVAELAGGSPDFAAMWKEQHVLAREGGERCFRHPEAGAIVLRQVTLVPADEPDFKLVMLLPA